MRITKEVLLEGVKGLYAVGSIEAAGALYYGVASENRDGEVFLLDSKDGKVYPVNGGPGGVMSLVDVPGENAMLSIEEFYPVFDSVSAKIVKIGLEVKEGQVQVSRKVLTDAAYVHRISLLKEEDGIFLAAGILCSHKDFQDDWSRAGSMQIGRYTPGTDHVELETVYDGVFKHHAMYVRRNQAGYDDLYFGGTEGVFCTRRKNGQWITEHVLDVPASDIVVYDLDGDGQEELAIIEGFHGDNVAVFRQENGWKRALDIPAEFGHVLWGGAFLGAPGLIAGSRGGSKELVLYRLKCGNAGGVEIGDKTVIDSGQAPAQILVLDDGRQVVAANHGVAQLARYSMQ